MKLTKYQLLTAAAFAVFTEPTGSDSSYLDLEPDDRLAKAIIYDGPWAAEFMIIRKSDRFVFTGSRGADFEPWECHILRDGSFNELF